MENLQQQGKVLVLNSKLDFTRPFMTHLTMQKGSGNLRPGQQLPQSSRSANTLAHSTQLRRVKPFKMKPKKVKFRSRILRTSDNKISDRSQQDSQINITDKTQTEKTPNSTQTNSIYSCFWIQQNFIEFGSAKQRCKKEVINTSQPS